MARYRSRSRSLSRSYSPPRRRSRTPPRGRKRYDDDEPRDRYRDSRSNRDRRSPAPCGLLVRNLPLDARSDDLRIPFERFGPVKDVYLPKNYYTREPRGFGFVKYRYAEDAAEAKLQMNHTLIGGREIRIVFAEENRKTPQEMRTTTRVSGGSSRRRRTPPRSPRGHYRSYSRSVSPLRRDSRDHGAREHYRSPVQSRSISRSPSPRDEREYRRSHNPMENGRSPHVERDYSRSPSPRENGRDRRDERVYAPSRSRSPRGNNHSPM
ncbi:PREDICTED: serine/arginine-rich SC35-like splicing factor SCL28 [Fragaria vesca subsp. vesca]|uniref:serine/arginine-rich SC35-like splicing factor SCL28 n=1 Tax=Fragaria vesca subsp. vesca TaxID=101020 RepID=UPI0002C2DD5F|nr:PREDICTED: serine/arginine-rich SC35-like splicing factor SCL28 [Fragaria vesca subsp. vesca]